MDGSSIRHDPMLASGTASSARQMAYALISAGHRRLALIAAQRGDEDPPQFRDLCDMTRAASLPPGRFIATGSEPESLDRAFFLVFRGTHYPTGLVCADLPTAEAAVRSLRGLGFRVPTDLTVVWLAS
jgi:DNA-binding LacI/PurR family transcriptional regulator